MSLLNLAVCTVMANYAFAYLEKEPVRRNLQETEDGYYISLLNYSDNADDSAEILSQMFVNIKTGHTWTSFEEMYMTLMVTIYIDDPLFDSLQQRQILLEATPEQPRDGAYERIVFAYVENEEATVVEDSLDLESSVLRSTHITHEGRFSYQESQDPVPSRMDLTEISEDYNQLQAAQQDATEGSLLLGPERTERGRQTQAVGNSNPSWHVQTVSQYARGEVTFLAQLNLDADNSASFWQRSYEPYNLRLAVVGWDDLPHVNFASFDPIQLDFNRASPFVPVDGAFYAVQIGAGFAALAAMLF